MPVAWQAAGLFTKTDRPVKILDLGSGTGILSAVVAQDSMKGSSVLAIEQDPCLAADSRSSLDQVCAASQVITDSVFNVSLPAEFNRVILNPPYKKIPPIRIPSGSGDVKVTNLYTAFLVLAVNALAPMGECVAIIPRSWMNGEYFKDFRTWLLEECSIDVLAVYGSRQEHFHDMGILQEIMLLKISKRPQRSRVLIYDNVSPAQTLDEQYHRLIPLQSLLFGPNKIVKMNQTDSRLAEFHTLEEQGLWVSTGKLVWFRNRDILSAVPSADGYPLYWAENQHGLQAIHPFQGRHDQWATSKAKKTHTTLPKGAYCLVGRFSSKEQKKRIHASYLNSEKEFILDNKINYIHQGTSRKTKPLDKDVAWGLTLWLSTSIVDLWYRQISGSTQVNATDLRQVPCPTQKELVDLAQQSPMSAQINQEQIDQIVGGFFSWIKVS